MKLANNKKISNSKYSTIRKKVVDYQNKSGTRWEDDETAILIKEINNGKTPKEISEIIERTDKAIERKAYKLGFRFYNWNNKRLKILVQGILNGLKPLDIAVELNIDEKIVVIKAKRLKLMV